MLATATLVASSQINGAGRHVPESDLLRSGFRIQQAQARRSRSTISRSARAAASSRSPSRTVFFGATDGPMTPEQLQAAPGKLMHFPTVLGARRADLQHPERHAGAQVHGAAARRHLPRQDHEVERCRRSPRRTPASRCRRPTSSWCTVRTAPARPTSSWTTSSKVSPEWKKRVGVNTAVNWPTGVGGKGSDGVTGQVKPDAGRHRLRRADVRALEQDRLRVGPELRRQVRQGQRLNR